MSDYYHIKGVGIDIVEISRITDMLQNNPSNLKKIFTKDEISQCLVNKNMYTAFALRYAAKQATVKSLGKTGHFIPLNEIEIHIHGTMAVATLNKYWYDRYFPGQRVIINLSLSIYADFAMAQATVQSRKVFRGRINRKTLASFSN